MTTEHWKAIPGYEGRYEISDIGNIRSLISAKKGPFKTYMSKGYPRVGLFKAGKQKPFYIHQLVLLAFVGPIPEGMQCHHRNTDKKDARLKNLEYKDSGTHISEHLKGTTRTQGSKHGMHKLTEGKVRSIRWLHHCGISISFLAEDFHVSVPTVSMIVNRKTWRHI